MLTAEAIGALRDILELRAAPVDNADGGKTIIVPDGYRPHVMPPLEKPLTRIHQQVTLHDMPSFLDYVNAYKTANSRIFAEPGFVATNKEAHLVAYLDYHWPAHKGDDATAAHSPLPDHVRHAAVYAPRYSDAWARWMGIKGEIEQATFAELVEECRVDIVDPPAAALLDLISTFKATKKVEFNSLAHQRDGSVVLQYSDEVQKSGSTIMPEKLVLGIPVYYRGAPFEVDVLVRFKVDAGKVKFRLVVHRPDRIEDAAFESLVADVAEKTALPVHRGRI